MKNELSSHKKTWKTLTKWKKPICKDYIPYDSNYMTFWKRQNYGDSENIRGCQGWAGGSRRRKGWRGGAQRIFQAAKLFYMISWWWLHVQTQTMFKPIHLSKPRQCSISKVNPKVIYGLWVIMGQCTILVSNVDNGGGYTCVGTVVYEKSLSFVLNLKLLSENCLFQKLHTHTHTHTHQTGGCQGLW